MKIKQIAKAASLRFPVGGMSKRSGFQNQPPYTTPDCLNVRPFDALDGRERGGSRGGLKKAYAQALGSPSPVQLLRPIMVVDHSGNQYSRLMAIAGGSVGVWDENGSYTSVTGSLNPSAPTLQAAQIGVDVIIANYRPTMLSGTTATADIASGNKLTDSAVADWTALSISTDLDSVFIFDIADELVDIYPIEAVSLGDITITKSGTPLPVGPCSYQIGRQLARYDTETGVLSKLTATYGVYPMGCKLCCAFRDRLILAGPDNGWYASRQGDVSDWDYAYDPEDAARPVAGGTDPNLPSNAADPIRALIPSSGDKLIFGCDSSLWLMTGDPTGGGSFYCLSREIGCVGANAWCSLPDGSTLILSRDGIYLIAPIVDAYPVPISTEVLPRELINVDSEANSVSMIYDIHGRGVHIFITPTTAVVGTHWFFDLATKSFWPDQYPDEMQPMCVSAYYTSAGADRNTLLGSKDGYVRYFSDDQSTDDGDFIDSYVTYGPIRLGQYGKSGKVVALSADLAEDSDNADWELHVADTSEAVVNSTTPECTGEWEAGSNTPVHRLGRGQAGKLVVGGTGQWAIENVNMTLAPSGRAR